MSDTLFSDLGPRVRRVVCLFSCGAASAVATKLTLADATKGVELVIHNNEVIEEHPDNKRFLADCERWFGHPITTLRNEKYGASIYEVFRRERFIKGQNGAPCTKLLKRNMTARTYRPGDQIVLGFTAEETDRLDKYIDANPTHQARAPLIERGLTKADCLAMIQRAGIELPAMYRLGYKNNNCRGCVKGGKGYWNKIRVDFPEFFARMSAVEQLLGPGSYLFQGAKKGDPRISLKDLDPKAGRYQDEPDISCSAVCELIDFDPVGARREAEGVAASDPSEAA